MNIVCVSEVYVGFMFYVVNDIQELSYEWKWINI